MTDSFRKSLMHRTARAIGDFLAMASVPKPAEVAAEERPVALSKKRGRRKQQHAEMPQGRPWNVSANGKVWRHPGVRISDRTIPHMVDGKQHISQLKSVHGGKNYVVPLHRAVSIEIFRGEMETRRRAAAGRYVGPFNFPARA